MRFHALNAATSSALMTQGAPLHGWVASLLPRRIIRRAVIFAPPMIFRRSVQRHLAPLGLTALTMNRRLVLVAG